jgi:hypothetical protein
MNSNAKTFQSCFRNRISSLQPTYVQRGILTYTYNNILTYNTDCLLFKKACMYILKIIILSAQMLGTF